MKTKIQVGDSVTLLREELLDDRYHDKDRTRVAKDTIMEVIAVAPKVRMCRKGKCDMCKRDGCDNNPYFLNLVMPNTTYPRVRTDFCNVKKVLDNH